MNQALKNPFLPEIVDLNDALHRRLAHFNRRRLCPATGTLDTGDAQWAGALREDLHMSLIEGQFIEAERRAIQPLMDGVPTDPDDFMTWFESLREHGPGQNDRLFDWLASDAGLPDMRWFLEQEVAGEAGFDDLVALTQVRMPVRAKLEMARNYWDELGRGRAVRMHGPMLERTVTELRLAPVVENTVWEALALANLMQGLACNRRYAYQSVGALGAVELTAPTRVVHVDAGLERLGISRHGRSYFILHASIDLKHSQDWNEEVIWPLIDGRPAVQRAIAEGALLRLTAGARCFERYRRALPMSSSSYCTVTSLPMPPPASVRALPMLAR
ncbi:MAG: iron-containing redox enzyme family protein [Panacagrimonas sp.]